MNHAIKLLATLVSMPTITADITANEQGISYIERYLTERGMHCRRQHFEGHPTLTASTRKNNHQRPIVCLSAHLDIVSADESQFTLREADGKLYGRGVYDMKFAIASYLQLVDDLAREGTLADYDFGIMITTDEEFTPGFDRSGVAYLINEGYRPRVALLPDSTAPGWEIEKVSKGWWRFDLIATGKAVHSGRPWEGESASIKLIHALHELKEHFTDHGPTTDTLNIGNISGNQDMYNRVPDQMAAKVEIRLVDNDSLAKNQALVKDLCRRHKLTCETFSTLMPVWPILEDPLVDAYKNAVEQIAGKRPQDFISLGGSDAPYFTNAGVPCILSCPLGGGHHSDTEWLDKQSFLQYTPILHAFLEQIARRSAPVDKPVAKAVQ